MRNIVRAGLACPIFAIILFLAFAAYGQQQERVAVIQTVDDRDSIGISELAFLTDRLRETASNVLPKQRYGVMTTESIVAFLGSQERAMKECNEASCLADLGRKVNADYVAQGRVGRFDGNLTIKTELYNSKSGVMVGSFTGTSKNISGLLALIDEKASVLFKKLPGASDEPTTIPPSVAKSIDVLERVDYELDEKPFAYAKPVADDKPYVPMPEVEKSSGASFWAALGLDVLGAALIYAGYSKHQEMWDAYGKYYEIGSNSAWEEVENNRSSRNTFYAIGGIILASGIGVHIWF